MPLTSDCLPVRVTTTCFLFSFFVNPAVFVVRYLDLLLPHDVEDDSKCSAARDKSGLLKITMPVKQPPASPLTVPPPPAAVAGAAAGGSCCDGDGGGAAAAADIDGGSEQHKVL